MKIKVQITDDLSKKECVCFEINAREHMAAQAIDRYMRVKKQREAVLRKCLMGEYPIVAYDTETCEVVAEGTLFANVFAGTANYEIKNL